MPCQDLLSFPFYHSHGLTAIIPDPFLLCDPPPAHLRRVLEPVGRVLPVRLEHPRLQPVQLPCLQRPLLSRVPLQVREPVLEALFQRQDEAVGDLGGCNREQRPAGVDEPHVPDLAAVVAASERAQEGLALVLVHEGRGDAAVVLVQGMRLYEQIEDRGDDREGGHVGGDVDPGKSGMSEDERHAEVADVSVLEGPCDFGVFGEGLTAIVRCQYL